MRFKFRLLSRNQLAEVSMKLEPIFTLLCLVITAWATLGTSSPTHSIANGSLTIKSDCPGAIKEGQVRAVSGAIIDPGGQTFLDYGFPQSVVSSDESIAGLVGGIERTCTRTVGSNIRGDDSVYSCYEQGQFMCSIYVLQSSN
jgi:hypothetical protein